MLLVIDNYDSFTFNLVQYLGELAPQHPIAADLRVHRNDELDLAAIRELRPDAILLSPGPGDPDQSGVCLDILRELSPSTPTLGVCLGHQAIAQVHGGRVVRAVEQMHGKTSAVLHRGEGVFAGLPQPLTATRYHSLIAERDSLPECLEVTAWLEDGTIMGLRHRNHPHLLTSDPPGYGTSSVLGPIVEQDFLDPILNQSGECRSRSSTGPEQQHTRSLHRPLEEGSERTAKALHIRIVATDASLLVAPEGVACARTPDGVTAHVEDRRRFFLVRKRDIASPPGPGEPAMAR